MKEEYFIDSTNPLWCDSVEKTEEFLKECENRWNELLNANGEVSLYEVYTIVGFIDERSEKCLSEEYVQQLKTTGWKKGRDGLVSLEIEPYFGLRLAFDASPINNKGDN